MWGSSGERQACGSEQPMPPPPLTLQMQRQRQGTRAIQHTRTMRTQGEHAQAMPLPPPLTLLRRQAWTIAQRQAAGAAQHTRTMRKGVMQGGKHGAAPELRYTLSPRPAVQETRPRRRPRPWMGTITASISSAVGTPQHGAGAGDPQRQMQVAKKDRLPAKSPMRVQVMPARG